MTIAPAGFGTFSGDLLVGNFGDGRIHAFDPTHAQRARHAPRRRRAPDPHRRPLGLAAGQRHRGRHDQVVFSAGPNDESHGLLGVLSLR